MSTPLSGDYYAILGIGGFNLQLQDASLVPLTTILQYDLSNTIQFKIDVRYFNQKINLLKDSQNRRIIDTSYSIINSAFPTETFTISPTEFNTVVTDTSNILSVGFYENIYNDYAALVQKYFGAASGFASLYKNVKAFNINNGVFDASALLTLISGTDDISGSTVYSLSGEIDISNVNSLLAYAVDNNVFGNRDGNGFAADWDNSNNYGVGDGFLSNDIIYVPQGSTIQLGLNIAPEAATTPRNNKGPQNVASIVAATNYTDGDFSVVTNVTTEIISRTLTAPIVIQMIDTSPNSAVTLGTIQYSIDYINTSVSITFTDYSYNFFVALWNNGASSSGYVYDNSFSTTEINVYELNTFYITPFINTGISGVGESETFYVNFVAYISDFNTSNIQYNYVTSGYQVDITFDLSLTWTGFYTYVNILANSGIIDTQTPPQPMLVVDGQYSIIGNDATTETLWEYQAIAYDNSDNPSSSSIISFIPTPIPTITDSSVVNVETFFDVSGQDISGDWIVNISASASVTWSGFYDTINLYRNTALILTESSNTTYYTADASYQMTDLDVGTAYAFYLTPYDASGVGATSSPVINITTPIIEPRVLTFELYNPFTYNTVEYVTTISFELFLVWSGYYYGVKLFETPSTLLQQQTFTTTKYVTDVSFDVTDVATYTIGQTYSFYITPIDSGLTEYTPTETLTIDIWSDPVITLISISNVVTLDLSSTLTINWDGYYDSVRLYQDDEFLSTVIATQYTNTGITYDITDLVSDTSYAFNLIPRDSVGDPYSSSPYIIITTPQAPYNMNVIGANNNLTVVFSVPTSGTVTQYEAFADDAATVSSQTGTSSPIIVTGLSPNTDHTVWVTATFDNGYTATSASIIGNTSSTPPTDPVIQSLGISTATTVDTTSTVTLLWSGYYDSVDVYQDASFIANVTTTVWENVNITYDVTNLISDTSYSFYIVPRDSLDVEYAASNTIIATTPLAPYNLNVITTTTQFTVVFSMPDEDITQYEATADQVNGNQNKNVVGTSSPIVITGLRSNEDYNVWVVATYANGYTATSETVAAFTETVEPTVPIIQSLTEQTMQTVVTNSSFELLWTGYYDSVEIYENDVLLTTVVATQWLNQDITYSLTNRTALTEYQYYLLPYESSVAGVQSATLTVTPPDAPVITNTTPANRTITVTFTEPTIISSLVIDEYNVYVYRVSDDGLASSKKGTGSPITVRQLTRATDYYVNVVATFTNTYESTSDNAFDTTT